MNGAGCSALEFSRGTVNQSRLRHQGGAPTDISGIRLSKLEAHPSPSMLSLNQNTRKMRTTMNPRTSEMAIATTKNPARMPV